MMQKIVHTVNTLTLNLCGSWHPIAHTSLYHSLKIPKKKVGLKVSLNQQYLQYYCVCALCSTILKHLVVSPRLVFGMFNTVNRCYCYTGIKFVLPKSHSGTERIRLSTVPTCALHPARTHATHRHTRRAENTAPARWHKQTH